jgi:phosphate starvation-inducible protein PhoH and related proteins
LTELTIPLDTIDPVEFLGVNNARLNKLKDAFPKLKLVARGNRLRAEGNQKELEMLEDKVMRMIRFVERFGAISEKHMDDFLEDVESGDNITDFDFPQFSDDAIVFGPNGNVVKARTENQKKMVELSEKNDIIFAIGPAGTGKTYTAVALAVRALKNKQIKKIILTRPAVEAGESLGFLPGDLKEKVDPYLRPLYDALDDMIPLDKLNYYLANRIIEIAPLAFMRGRTLDHAYVLLDEAQNATGSQLKMFLTRIGSSAKCVITGDLTQIDLPKNQTSGLFQAIDLLKDIEGIATIFLNDKDVVRHKLVKQIIRAYEKLEGKDNTSNHGAPNQKPANQ